MLLDWRGTFGSDIGKGRRTNHSKERNGMVRCRYQDGCLFIRGKKRKKWVIKIAGRWLVDVRGLEPLTPCLQSRCSPS
jgi:hypothetical protein